jgi:hypothetical protein
MKEEEQGQHTQEATGYLSGRVKKMHQQICGRVIAV